MNSLKRKSDNPSISAQYTMGDEVPLLCRPWPCVTLRDCNHKLINVTADLAKDKECREREIFF